MCSSLSLSQSRGSNETARALILLLLLLLLTLPLLELLELGLAERLQLALLLLALRTVLSQFLFHGDTSHMSVNSIGRKTEVACGRLTALRLSTVTRRLLSVASDSSVIYDQGKSK